MLGGQPCHMPAARPVTPTQELPELHFLLYALSECLVPDFTFLAGILLLDDSSEGMKVIRAVVERELRGWL